MIICAWNVLSFHSSAAEVDKYSRHVIWIAMLFNRRNHATAYAAGRMKSQYKNAGIVGKHCAYPFGTFRNPEMIETK